MKNSTLKNRRSFIKSLAALTFFFPISPLKGLTTLSTVRKNNDQSEGKLLLGMVVFEGFQLLDTFGPLEMFGSLHQKVEIILIGQEKGAVKSSAGPAVYIDRTFDEIEKLDILMIPGGKGTRREVNNEIFLKAIINLSKQAPHVASICTGAAILAKAGVIDGLKATTNKRAFKWATSQSDKVIWIKQARWVEDGKFFTSSGISAGTDMALALIQKLFGKDEALRVANSAEYVWNNDPHHDLFARMNGLID